MILIDRPSLMTVISSAINPPFCSFQSGQNVVGIGIILVFVTFCVVAAAYFPFLSLSWKCWRLKRYSRQCHCTWRRCSLRHRRRFTRHIYFVISVVGELIYYIAYFVDLYVIIVVEDDVVDVYGCFWQLCCYQRHYGSCSRCDCCCSRWSSWNHQCCWFCNFV